MTVKTEDIVFKLSADNKKLSQQLKESRSALRSYSTQAKQTTGEQNLLAGAFSKSASQVAIFQGPLNGVSGRLSAVATSLRSVNPLFLGFGVAASAATLAIVNGTTALDEYEVNLKRSQALLNATDYASGFTAKQLQEQAKELALNTLTSTQEVQKAQAQLQTFNRVSSDSFTRAITLAQDLAETGFGSLTGNATMLGKALQDPITGISALTRVGVSFTEQQKEQIITLAKSGEVLEAQGLILDAVAGQVEGAGKSVAVNSIAGSSDTLGQNIEELTIAIAKMSGAKDAAVRFLDETANAVKNATDYIERSDERRLQSLTKERLMIRAQIAEYKGLTNLPTINPFGKSENELNNLQVRFAMVDREMREITDKRHQEQLADAEEVQKAKEGAVNAELEIMFATEEAKSQANIKAAEKREALRQKDLARDKLAAEKAAADRAVQVDSAVLTAQQQTEQLQTELQRRVTIAADLDNQAIYEELYRYQDKQTKLQEQYQADQELAIENYAALQALKIEHDASMELLKQDHEANITEIEQKERDKRAAAADEQNQKDKARQQELMSFYSGMATALGDYYNDLTGSQSSYVSSAINLAGILMDEEKRNAIQSIYTNTYDTAMKAYNSLASIPYVGPVLGAAAAGGVIAAGGVYAAKVSGMAHDGISEVPNEGTWLLDKGERVYTNDSANKLDQMYNTIMGNGSSGNGNSSGSNKITINLIEDASKAGQTSQSTGLNGEDVITIVVSNIRQGGEIASAQEQTYNLQRAGY